MVKLGIGFGYIISNRGIEVNKANIDFILNLLPL